MSGSRREGEGLLNLGEESALARSYADHAMPTWAEPRDPLGAHAI